jgi:RNA polymerase sigma-70 factor (ECF subfamily)
MDELDLLRTLRSDAPALADGARRAALTALRERIASPGRTDFSRAMRTTDRRPVIALLGVAAAAALVLTLVMTNLVGLAGWRGGADSAAAAVLNRAADQVVFTDAELDPHQYLLIERAQQHVSTIVNDDDPPISYFETERSELYVPAIRSLDWVWIRPRRELVGVITPGGQSIVNGAFQGMAQQFGDSPERLRAPGGAFYGVTTDGPWGDYDDMPRDPYRLLNHIYRVTLGAGPSPDGEALVFIADTLRQGTAPADLRRALLQAATMIPGVTVTDEQANLDGRIGIAVGRDEENSGIRQELIFDQESGDLIGERRVVIGDTGLGLDIGTVYSWSSTRTSVVSSAPAGGTPNGYYDLLGCEPGSNPGTWECPEP